MSPWRRVRANPEDWFSAEEISKARRYVRPLRRILTVGKVVGWVVDLAVVGMHLAPRLLSGLGLRSWPARLAVAVALVSVTSLAAGVGFDAWRELSYDKRWGFSTQTARGFVSDQAKSLLVGVVVFSLLGFPLWALIRATSAWWLYGWGVVVALSVGLAFLGPVLILPLFNRFTPLGDAGLRESLLALARDAGADVREVLVSDASRRTRRDNAFVTGVGRTRRLVVFDTMLSRPVEQVRSVAAHEIGHWKRRHILRTMPATAAGLFAVFAGLRLVLDRPAALRFAGVRTLHDPAALPLFLLLFQAFGAVTGLLGGWLSRVNEREADLFALRVTGDTDSFIALMRALHVDNLADLAPSWWRRLTQTHPPAAERMAMGARWGRAR